MERAKAMRERAHAPYSTYYVGAAILDENGEVHVGCNVENSSYPLGACAEAGAIGAMVAAGGKRIAKIAVAGGGIDLEVCTPCGGCRQRILEFSSDSTEILSLDEFGRIVTHSIADLLPAPTEPNVERGSGNPVG
jgi:cytidine deaminase